MSKSIAKKIETRIGNVKVSVVTNTKVNVIRTGYEIDNGSSLTPTIYVPSELKNDEDIIDWVVNAYENLPTNPIDVDLLTDRDYVLSHITPEVINGYRNRELLGKVLCKPFLDLALVFRVNIGEGSCLLSKVAADMLDIDVDDIKVDREYCLENFFGMPVVRTKDMKYGAAAITDYDFLKELGDTQINKKFIIIPSSIHELIILPYSSDVDISDLYSIIADVNKTAVADEDFLSNNAYIWDGEKVVIA